MFAELQVSVFARFLRHSLGWLQKVVFSALSQKLACLVFLVFWLRKTHSRLREIGVYTLLLKVVFGL